jgi:tripartite ATP-independent transporter DctM subunit
MPWYETMLILIGAIVALMMLGFPVPFAFLTVNCVAAYFLMGGIGGIIQVLANATTAISTFTLVAIPMFLLMGELFFRTKMVLRVFDTLEMMLGRLPGRLSYLAVGGGTLFSALIGSSMANTAMLGSLLVGEMDRRGYKPHMSIGPIIGTGGLAIIIPPSGLAVLLGSLANIDIGGLLIGGFLPGLLLAALYAALIFLQVKIDPSAAPTYDVERPPFLTMLVSFVLNVLPMGLVIFCVVGMILLGWATPTESAVFGVLAVLVLAVLMRCLSWKAITESVTGAVRVTASIYLIIVGSSTFSQILAYTGASSGFIDFAVGLDVSPTVMLLIMFGVLLILGMLMDPASILLLTVPIFFPLAAALNFDPIWFGLIVLLGLEMGLTTPPFGVSLFVMMGVAPRGTTFFTVVKAAVPYLCCDLIAVIMIMTFPVIVTYLPSLMQR